MENALADFLGAPLVPILRAYVSACAAGYIHLILVFVAAFWALPDEFAVFVLYNFYLSVEAAYLAIVAFCIEFGL